MQIPSPLVKALATSSTSATFTAYIPTRTEPSGAGVFDIFPSINLVPEALKVNFFGTGADNDAFDARLIGWERVPDNTNPEFTLWIPNILATFTCTRSSMVGVANCKVVAADRFVDTLVVHATLGPQAKFTDADSGGAASRGTVEIFSPANNLMAWAIVPLRGFDKIQYDFALTAGTDMNALHRFIRQVDD